MGNCCAADTTTKRAHKHGNGGTYEDGPLTKDDIQARISAPEVSQAITIGDYSIRFAYVSQRGYYPDALSKPNQDSVLCAPQLSKTSKMALFSVFDGHGSHGDVCANFAKEMLPKNLVRLLKKEGVDDALSKAHTSTNSQMHSSDFDDSMSGTTAISVLFDRSTIHVSNVGDSRAIIAQEVIHSDGTIHLVSKPLSIDQTPFRRDERERVKKTGARVMTVDQIDGIEPMHENWGLTLGDEIDESGDPPRIWHPIGDYPGTAFTRSIGDAISEELGVVAEPEILSKALNKDDKFIVIASDGVFEFLTSQAVVDMVKEYSDPLEACRAVVEEAYNRWLQYEVRTDDISMICIFLDEITTTREIDRGSIYSGAEVLDMENMQRPVRGVGSRGPKRDTILGTEGIRLSMTHSPISEEDETFDVSEHVIAKSKEDEECIRRIVKPNFLFKNLSETKLGEIISVMSKRPVKEGDVIIRQGDVGETFYIISHGEYEVRVKSADDSSGSNNFGDIVHRYKTKSEDKLHPCFGDLALMYSKPRAATVIATSKGELWELSRLAYRSILMQRPTHSLIKVLRGVEAMKPLTIAQLQRLAEELKTVSFLPGEIIIKEGDVGDKFYLIESGSVKCTKTTDAGEENIIAELGKHEYFGEKSLLLQEPRAATVSAVTKTTCLCIGRRTFEKSVGEFKVIIEKDCSRRKRLNHLRDSLEKAEKNKFVLFTGDNYSTTSISIDDVSTAFLVLDNYDEIIRVVDVKVIGKRMTLKSISKHRAHSRGLHKQVVGEQNVYISLERFSGLPMQHSILISQRNIHVLYEEILVGTLETFLDTIPKSKEVIRFIGCQILLILKYFHGEGVLCRSISPPRLMVDNKGYLQVVNLRLSKYVGTGRTYTLCGDTDYLSPDQVKGTGHTLRSDLWSMGIFLYELFMGKTPFYSEKDSDLETFNKIVDFTPDQLEWNEDIDNDSKSIIEKLLLFSNDVRVDDVWKHPFFSEAKWESIKTKAMQSPLLPHVQDRLKQLEQGNISEPIDFGEEYTGEEIWWNSI